MREWPKVSRPSSCRPALSGGDHERAGLDGPRPVQHVPMRLAGLLREAGRRRQERGAVLGERPVEGGEAHVVADRHARGGPRASRRAPPGRRPCRWPIRASSRRSAGPRRRGGSCRRRRPLALRADEEGAVRDLVALRTAIEPICTTMPRSRATSRKAASVGSRSSGPTFSNRAARSRSTSEVISGVCTKCAPSFRGLAHEAAASSRFFGTGRGRSASARRRR